MYKRQHYEQVITTTTIFVQGAALPAAVRIIPEGTQIIRSAVTEVIMVHALIPAHGHPIVITGVGGEEGGDYWHQHQQQRSYCGLDLYPHHVLIGGCYVIIKETNSEIQSFGNPLVSQNLDKYCSETATL